jgi:hypothetical protein
VIAATTPSGVPAMTSRPILALFAGIATAGLLSYVDAVASFV